MIVATRHAMWGLLTAMIVALPAICIGEETPAKAANDNPAGVEFFEQHIRPVLVAHCYKCHSADSKTLQGGLRLDDRQAMRAGGDSGPAVVPGKAGESLLLQAIEYEGKLYDMPPDGKLSAKTIADFRRWIEMGAPDPRLPKADKPSANSPGTDASRKDLWVMSPLRRPDIPAASDAAWAQGTVDRFVLATLDKKGVKPAAPADHYTLLRRVTFDLTGLPPTPDEIQSYTNDLSEMAWERVVDRLLASPAFGDHWARHWFDLSCYADLADVQGNVVVQGAWRYRDYVIDAFNHDKPIDRFIAEQIAGDLLPYDSASQRREHLIATGFLSIGPWALQNYVKPQLQADVVDHQIDKVGRTFLGMSVRCARCHDHKFDPIPTRDYYALAGIFHGTLTTRYDGPGVWSQVVSRELPPVTGDREAMEFENTAKQLTQQRTTLEAELRQLDRQSSSVKFTEKVASPSANSLTLATPIAANEANVEYGVSFAAGPTVWSDAAQATGADDGIVIQVLRKDGSVLAFHEHSPGAWSGSAESQKLHAASFTYRGDGSGPVTLHITASRLHTGRFAGAIDDLAVTQTADSKVVFNESFDGYRPGRAPGQQAHTRLPVYAFGTFPRWNGGGVNHSHAVGSHAVAPSGQSSQQDVALQIFSGKAGAPTSPQAAKIQGILNDITSRLRLLDYARPSRTHALAVQDVANPRDFPVYARGNFRTPGNVVPRGALSAIHDEPFPAIPPGTSGRKELAQWLTGNGNPVTPRVLANRVWQHLFGAGLVRTVDYFGIHGDQPSHPELLDYLAIRFRDDARWSLKTLVRELVLSNAYRMSSEHNAQAAQSDPDNRFLWRMNRRRLTAESIRDGILATSGSLDSGRGGDSLGLEIPGNVGGIGDQVNLPTYSRSKIPDHVVRRRSVYLPLLRSPPDGPLEILGVFDFPHPSEITGQRPERTVATQALFLLNAPFVKEQAERTADLLSRLAEAAKPMTMSRESTACTCWFSIARRAHPKRTTRSSSLSRFSKARARRRRTADLQRAAWAEFCHALYASNDFLFME